MPELIDKAKVLKYLTQRIKTVTPYGEWYNKALEDSAELVALMPTIEAEPVRHGRWKQRRNGEYYCTNCGREERLIFQKNFCPRCGARMDLRTPTEVSLDIADSVMMGGADNDSE